MLRRLTAFALALALAWSAAGCGQSDSGKSNVPPGDPSKQKKGDQVPPPLPPPP